eukprot:GHUV01023120.1.p1 GENE.GHUV01023120.1~~GHUV01023120.1.p1  ORF type:complete len:214 (+),score=41.41 GHUV01023120.1:87-644(+)
MNHADTTNTAQSTTHNNDQAVAEQSLPWSPQSSEERLHHTDLTTKPCDIICAFNFSVCLLHKRHEVLQYFRNVHSALCVEPGGLFVMDLMGGHSVEAVRSYKRIHFKTGIRCGELWQFLRSYCHQKRRVHFVGRCAQACNTPGCILLAGVHQPATHRGAFCWQVCTSLQHTLTLALSLAQKLCEH